MKAVNDGVGRTAQKQRREQGQTCRHRQQTGYSLATVSKALNGKADISEAARQAIDKALKDNG